MKKLFLLFILFAFCGPGFAQKENRTDGFNKNNIKLNLFGLPLRSFSFQYERGLNRKMSVSLGVRLQPKGTIPLKNYFENSLDDATDLDTVNAGRDFIQNAQINSWAITPEFRYYFGKKPLNGFYVAPFVRIGGYGTTWDYKYQKDDGSFQDVSFKGNSTAFSGGILFGAQWHFGKHILLDWWIIGPQYGSYTINLDAASDLSGLSEKEKQDLKNDIEGVGFDGNKFKAEVTNTGVKADNKISLPGLRTGFCIGFTF